MPVTGILDKVQGIRVAQAQSEILQNAEMAGVGDMSLELAFKCIELCFAPMGNLGFQT